MRSYDRARSRLSALIRNRPWIGFKGLGDVGLGNQLFQIAATIGLARRIGIDPLLPPWGYEDRFTGPIPHRRLRHVAADDPRVAFHPDPTGFEYSPLETRHNVVLRGFFQSERYFEHCADETRRIFQPSPEIVARVRARHGDLLARRPWSLHVRRGDYVGSDYFADVSAGDYYDRALALMPEGTEVIVLSDDIPWTRERFAGRGFHFIEGQTDVEDMATMAMAAGNVIANSSFSWWGAWLGDPAGRTVVAPVAWFTGRFNDPTAPYSYFGYMDTRDLIPPRWHRI